MGWSEPLGRRAAVLASALLLLLPVPLAAQALIVEGDVRHPAAALLREIVERGDYRVLDRDTVLPAGSDLPHDLLVVDARVALEGTVRGAAAVIQGSLFVRPGARITGPVAEIAGDLFTSGNASTGERRPLPLEVRTVLSREDGTYRVRLVPPPRPPRVSLPRVLGVAVPTFDRVNGFTLGWGIAANPGRDTTGARLWGTALYHTERGQFGGEVGGEVPLGRQHWLSLVGASGSFTNDRWIRGPLENSAAALVFRSDAGDYHRSERVTLGLERRPEGAAETGRWRVAPRLALLLSRDRSLPAGDPWTLFDRSDPWRPNPPIDEGTLASTLAGASLAWQGATLRFAGDVGVEWAPEGVGDLDFLLLVADGDWRMAALWGHTVSVRARTHLPLGGTAAPRQRWSYVGGSGTLPTLERAALRGDHVAFVDSRYVVPVPRFPLPLVGPPSVRLQHLAGAAWITGAPRPRWEQSLGVGLELSLLEAMLYVDPARRPLRPQLNLGATLPAF